MRVPRSGRLETWVYQCKRHNSFTPGPARAAVRKILDDLKEPPDRIVLVTGCDVSRDTVLAFEEEATQGGVPLTEVWGATRLEEELYRHPELIRRFFGYRVHLGPHLRIHEAWIDAFPVIRESDTKLRREPGGPPVDIWWLKIDVQLGNAGDEATTAMGLKLRQNGSDAGPLQEPPTGMLVMRKANSHVSPPTALLLSPVSRPTIGPTECKRLSAYVRASPAAWDENKPSTLILEDATGSVCTFEVSRARVH